MVFGERDDADKEHDLRICIASDPDRFVIAFERLARAL
jgi:hypothetical protein